MGKLGWSRQGLSIFSGKENSPMKGKYKKKRQAKTAAPQADLDSTMPVDKRLPRSLVQPKSEDAVTQAKNWVDRNEL